MAVTLARHPPSPATHATQARITPMPNTLPTHPLDIFDFDRLFVNPIQDKPFRDCSGMRGEQKGLAP